MRQPHPREDLTGVILAQYRALVGLPVEPEPVTGYVTDGEASHEARLAERYVTRAHASAFVAEFWRSLQPEG